MSVVSRGSIVVEELTHGFPVTLVVECLDISKEIFKAGSFAAIYIHSVLGEHDIKTRKEYDKALKDNPDFTSIKSQHNMVCVTLNDAKKLVNSLNKQIMIGSALEELDEHR